MSASSPYQFRCCAIVSVGVAFQGEGVQKKGHFEAMGQRRARSNENITGCKYSICKVLRISQKVISLFAGSLAHNLLLFQAVDSVAVAMWPGRCECLFVQMTVRRDHVI